MKPILLIAVIVAMAGFSNGMAEGKPVEPVKNPYGAEAWVLPPETAKLKESEGIKGIQSNCLLCHSVDYISTQPKLTRAQWTAGVEKMRAKFGAVISTNTVPQIVDYLTVNYGRENPKP